MFIVLEKSTIENAKKTVLEVFQIRKGRKLTQLSDQERQEIKEIYDSSWDLYVVLDYVGFGYRPNGNRVSRLCDSQFRVHGDDRGVSKAFWKSVEDSLRHWDGGTTESFLKLVHTNFRKCRNSSKGKDKIQEKVPLDDVVIGCVDQIPIEEREKVIEIRDYLLKNVRVNRDKEDEFQFLLDSLIYDVTQSSTIKFPVTMLAKKTAQRFGGTESSKKKFVMRIRKKIQECLKKKLALS